MMMFVVALKSARGRQSEAWNELYGIYFASRLTYTHLARSGGSLGVQVCELYMSHENGRQ